IRGWSIRDVDVTRRQVASLISLAVAWSLRLGRLGLFCLTRRLLAWFLGVRLGLICLARRLLTRLLGIGWPGLICLTRRLLAWFLGIGWSLGIGWFGLVRCYGLCIRGWSIRDVDVTRRQLAW